MIHLPHLIQDLGLILAAAAIVSMVCRALKQPVVLGYLIAGFLVGPNFAFFPTVRDPGSVQIWAEIGVIFMLFGLGLEFSFPKLAKVGKAATITATFEIVFMLGVGYLAGRLLGWSTMDSLFMGGILSISSTTIIARAFEELKLKGRNFVALVFGVLIVEDLIAILLLVLLSSVAATQTLEGSELMASSLRLGFFMVLWFLMGTYLVPTLFRKLRKQLSDEGVMILSIALCLVMVVVASQTGFSPALGAFVMGSILAGTSEGHRIEKVTLPVKDLFSAVFFVSVGMMLDLKVLVEHYPVIVLFTLLTIVGKFISSSLGAILAGRSPRHAVQAGLSLAQIGEFSFIIATLGMTLKVTSDFLHPIAVAVSAITTFGTPYQIKNADRIYALIDRSMPAGLKQSLARYETAMSMSSGKRVVSLLWREYGLKILLNSVVVIAISGAMRRLTAGWDDHWRWIAGLAALALSAPFFWAIFFGKPSHADEVRGEIAENLSRLQIGISLVRVMVGFALAAFVVSGFTSVVAGSGVVLAGLVAIGMLLFGRFAEPLYRRIEGRFVANLSEGTRAALSSGDRAPELAPWNATLAQFTLSQYSPLVSKSLSASGIKETFGVTVTMIERGEKRIFAPSRDDLLLPLDRLFLIGTDEQLSAVRELIEAAPTGIAPPSGDSYGLTPLKLTAEAPFVNRTIRECGIREAVGGLIVGVERGGQRHLSPDSSMILLPGDLVWIVGDRIAIRGLQVAH